MLYFKKDIRAFQNEQKLLYHKLVKPPINPLTNYICQKCNTALKHSIVPRYAVPHNIRTNNALQHVEMLTQLEEHLVSL